MEARGSKLARTALIVVFRSRGATHAALRSDQTAYKRAAPSRCASGITLFSRASRHSGIAVNLR